MHDIEPGESQHPDNRNNLIALLEKRAEYYESETRIINVQIEWAQRAATTTARLERQLSTETDSDKCIELARKINEMYRIVMGLLRDEDTNQQAGEYETDN